MRIKYLKYEHYEDQLKSLILYLPLIKNNECYVNNIELKNRNQIFALKML